MNGVLKSKRQIIILLIFFSFFVFQAAYAIDANSSGLNQTANIGLGDGSSNDIPFSGLEPHQIIGRVIGIGLSFIGVLFFALLIYGGFNWMTARSNEEEAKKALELIQAAIFGLVIVLIAYAVAKFLTGAFIANNLS